MLEVRGVVRRETLFRLEDANRRRGIAEEAIGLPLGAVVCDKSCVTSRAVVRSVWARDGARKRASSSSSPTVPRRLRTSRDVLRPSSGSSVPARLVLRRDEPLPSSGSSVPARRFLDIMSEDLR